ncbi:phosphatase PAP2 family protein [Tepidibacillus infernus]|uniref:phosphatase PAP2 family protein n=1 Tax=Tepidibacillus TaxID=1494427 RepID=UPI000857F1AF|nr:phosphatase PAP2 family protein [Tepidibacillus sp. HK-1]GBF10351.1 putative undecaprenyl-diphosphatase YbjG [Tepidibacillus sp. HK-1]
MNIHHKNKQKTGRKIGFLLLLSFGLIAAFVSFNKIQWFDLPIIIWVQSLENSYLTEVMKFFTWIGSTKIVIAIIIITSIILYVLLKHRIELVFFVIVIIGSTALNNLLKVIFHRERPTIHRIIEETGYSFPSGHSMAAFTLYAMISFLLWKHLRSRFGRGLMILFATVMILLIGISRIYLGVHFPSDVLGGYLASGVWFTLSVMIYQWYLERRAKRNK